MTGIPVTYKTTGHFLPFSTTVGLNIAPDVAQSPYLINEGHHRPDPRTSSWMSPTTSSLATLKANNATSVPSQRSPTRRFLAPPVQVLQHQLRERAHQLFRRRNILAPSVYNFDRPEGQLDVQLFTPIRPSPWPVHNGNRPRHRTGLRDGIQVRIPLKPLPKHLPKLLPELDSDDNRRSI